ncbi:MAG: maleate cis-trans isomerase, partial [Methanomicrobia archaeon]|nr:maleate cis-trans isomerase [Methanomicrobia archaeon]
LFEKKILYIKLIQNQIKAEKQFLEKQGFEVLKMEGLDIVNPTDIGRLPLYKAYEMGRRVDSKEADTIFISCTDFRTFEIISPLERDLGKPVISSNQASLWMALKLLSIHMEEELGSLFSITK